MNFNKNLVNEIIKECENRRSEGYKIQLSTTGSDGWPKRCGPLAAYALKAYNSSYLNSTASRGYYRFSFDKAAVLKYAASALSVNLSWVTGFQKGVSTRSLSLDIRKLFKKSNLNNGFFLSYEEGFHTGREVRRLLKAPSFDKKPASEQLGRALRRAFKAGLSREDIRHVVDEYMAESILEQ